MPLKKGMKAMGHNPVDAGFGESPSQGMQKRQGMNDISQGTGLYDENMADVFKQDLFLR